MHILFALLTKKTPLKMGIQGTKLYIFVWHLKSEFFKKEIFEILNPKKSICLKMMPKSQAKNKTLFLQYPFF